MIVHGLELAKNARYCTSERAWAKPSSTSAWRSNSGVGSAFVKASAQLSLPGVDCGLHSMRCTTSLEKASLLFMCCVLAPDKLNIFLTLDSLSSHNVVASVCLWPAASAKLRHRCMRGVASVDAMISSSVELRPAHVWRWHIHSIAPPAPWVKVAIPVVALPRSEPGATHGRLAASHHISNCIGWSVCRLQYVSSLYLVVYK